MGTDRRQGRVRFVVVPSASVLAGTVLTAALALGGVGLVPAAADPTATTPTTGATAGAPTDPAASAGSSVGPSGGPATPTASPTASSSDVPSASTAPTSSPTDPGAPTSTSPTTTTTASAGASTGTPGAGASAPTDPAQSDPADPAPTGPAPTGPAPTDPGPSSTGLSDPGPADPVPTLQPPIAWTLSALAAGSASPATTLTDLPVTVRTVCQAMVVANPGATRAVVVAWGDFGRSRPEHVVTVRAGAAVRVPVDRSRIDWAAGWVGAEEPGLGSAGRGRDVAVVQECDDTTTEVRAVVSAPCLSRRLPVTAAVVGADGRADLGFWVTRRGDAVTVTDGVLLANRPTPVDLSQSGPGDYVLTVAEGRHVVDQASFAVQDCVTTTLDCRAVTWTNPSGHAAVVLAFRDGRAPTREVRLPPGRSVRAVASSGAITWSATVERESGVRLSDAGSDAAAVEADGCDGGSARAGDLAATPATGSADSAATAVRAAPAGEGTAAPTSGPAADPAAPHPTGVTWWPALLTAVAVVGGVLGWRRRR